MHSVRRQSLNKVHQSRWGRTDGRKIGNLEEKIGIRDTVTMRKVRPIRLLMECHLACVGKPYYSCQPSMLNVLEKRKKDRGRERERNRSRERGRDRSRDRDSEKTKEKRHEDR